MNSARCKAALLLACAGLAAAGCSGLQLVDRQGYLMDDTLVASIQPGVDNRESVQGTLGRPSFVGQFDQRDWYYVSRRTRQLAFNDPQATEHNVIHIRFDEAGNVAAVERSGLDRVAAINPMNDETPTLGRERGFLKELFGNIGAVNTPGRPGANDPTSPQ